MVVVEQSRQHQRIGELVQLEFKAADRTPIRRLRERTRLGLTLSQRRVADRARPRHEADGRTASKMGNSTSVERTALADRLPAANVGEHDARRLQPVGSTLACRWWYALAMTQL